MAGSAMGAPPLKGQWGKVQPSALRAYGQACSPARN